MAMTTRPYRGLMSDWRLHLLIAIALVGLAQLLDGWHAARIKRLGVEPIDLQLPIHAGAVGPRRVQIGYAGAYELAVIVSGFSDTRTRAVATCRLGVSLRPEAECADMPPVLDLRWRFERLGVPTGQTEPIVRSDSGSASGQAHGGGFSPDSLSRRLMTFRGRVGDVYSLSVESRSDLAALERFKPRLRVEPTVITNEEIVLNFIGFDIGVWLARVAAAGLAIFACSLLVASRVRDRRDPKAG